MLNTLGKLLFFLSANSPVFLIWGVFQFANNPSVSLFLFAISLLSYVGMFCLFASAKQRQSKVLYNLHINNNVNSQMMEYMVSYILPFVSLNNINSIETFVALCIYYAVLFGIYLKSDVFYVNPILNLAGYSIYKVTYTEESKKKTSFLLTKIKEFNIPNSVRIHTIERSLFIYNEDKNAITNQ